jgi:hypothetical protein
MTTRSRDPLRGLRARRAARRTEGIDPFDAFYQAYVTVLLAAVAIVIVSGWVSDDPLAAEGRARLVENGPALLGLVSAVGLMVGLRSGSRGGPFAIEEPDIHHVLLGPIDYRAALRVPAVRQLRFLTFGSLVVGVVAGQLVAHRLPGGPIAWVLAGSIYALVTVGLAVGAAWVAAGARLRISVATAGGAVLVGWAAWNLALDGPSAPTTLVGRLALWPLSSAVVAAVAVPVTAAVCAAGLAGLGGVSLERLRHRSALVGHLRFAATMRDLRTVMILRRQLTQERVRQRPWLPRRRRGGRTVVVLRDWRSLMRTPATRLARMVALGVVGAIAAAGVWAGTTPLVVVAGLASYLAGLEAVEPLAQEIDHPTIHRLAPVASGSLLVRHLIVPAGTMLAVGGCGFASLAIGGVHHVAAVVAAITVVPAALAGTAGAAISTIKSQPEDPGRADATLAIPPEITGMQLVYQTAWPPGVATIGFLPVLAARDAASQRLEVIGAAASAAVPVLIVVGLIFAWVRYRDNLRAWTNQTTEQAAVRNGANTGGRG